MYLFLRAWFIETIYLVILWCSFRSKKAKCFVRSTRVIVPEKSICNRFGRNGKENSASLHCLFVSLAFFVRLFCSILGDHGEALNPYILKQDISKWHFSTHGGV